MIKLAAFTIKDFDQLIAWVDSNELLITIAGTYFSYPLTTEQLHKYLNDEKSYSFNIVDTGTNKVIGHAELVNMGSNTLKIDKLLIGDKVQRGKSIGGRKAIADNELAEGATEPERESGRQRQFFEFAGSLFSVAISPASSVVRVDELRSLRALSYDRVRRRVEENLAFRWEVVEGEGAIDRPHDQTVNFMAPAEPGLARVRVTVSQGDVERKAEALITVTRELLPQVGATNTEGSGLPGYTFESAPGESWRSKYDAARNVIVVNNGHRDFVYAARNKSLKLSGVSLR